MARRGRIINGGNSSGCGAWRCSELLPRRNKVATCYPLAKSLVIDRVAARQNTVDH